MDKLYHMLTRTQTHKTCSLENASFLERSSSQSPLACAHCELLCVCVRVCVFKKNLEWHTEEREELDGSVNAEGCF